MHGQNRIKFKSISFVLYLCRYLTQARGDAVRLGTALQTGRSRVWFSMLSLGVFHWRQSSGRTMDPASTQSVTEMSSRDFS